MSEAKQVKIEDLDATQIKALLYDQIVQRTAAERAIQVLEQELARRQQQAPLIPNHLGPPPEPQPIPNHVGPMPDTTPL